MSVYLPESGLSNDLQSDLKKFMFTFSNIYPCEYCAEDMRKDLKVNLHVKPIFHTEVFVFFHYRKVLLRYRQGKSLQNGYANFTIKSTSSLKSLSLIAPLFMNDGEMDGGTDLVIPNSRYLKSNKL